jgi:adenylate cyclase
VRRDDRAQEGALMDSPLPEMTDSSGPDNARPGKASSGASDSRAVTLFRKQTRLRALLAAVAGHWHKLHDRIQRMPLAYKFSFLITVIIVSCMLLLGTILVQQQSRQLEAQISEQGSTLARLMAKSAREPLLAEDKLALDSIASSFSNSSSVLGTAIATIDGELVTQAGAMFEEKNPLTRKDVGRIIRKMSGTHIWEWTPLNGARKETVMSFIQPISFQDVTAGYSMVTFSQAGMTALLNQAIQTIVGTTVLIITLGIAMSFALGRRITQPIDQLVHASHAIGNGEYTFRFKECRKDELGLLMEAFNEMAEGMLEKSQVKSALSRYVSPSVAREILSNLDDVGLSGKRVEGTVVFADIKGFTQISETIRPEDLVSILNRYFTLVTRACEINQGMVDKYMGDGVMLVFGAPEPDEDHAFHAITCALLIQRLVEYENRLRLERDLFPVEFRIGVNTGSMLAGNMGSRNRMEYTVVGDTVNLASRLCGITNACEIVISREMYQREDIRNRVLAGEYQSIHLRGISQPVSTYRVERLTAGYQDIIDRQFETIITSEADEASHA